MHLEKELQRHFCQDVLVCASRLQSVDHENGKEPIIQGVHVLYYQYIYTQCVFTR